MSPAPEPSMPNVPVDLYDFIEALTNEYKLFKDLVPEIDPQRILHNSIDFVYDRKSFDMWIRNVDWDLELTRDNCATGHALGDFILRLMTVNGPWFPVYLNGVATGFLSLVKQNFDYAGFRGH